MPTPTYNQPSKRQVRSRILGQAVTALTTARNHSSIVRGDEFRETLNYAAALLQRFNVTRKLVKNLDSETELWREFHATQIGQRTPRDLKVLYLCGPEPVNDLEVLLSLGIIPQNIWAIESQDNLYRGAIDQLRLHGSYIRVHNGKLEQFFNTVNERFDIIYIDACGPLPSAKSNTLRLLIAMVQHERLAPLGALITNFAEPNSANYDCYVELMSQYFAPRYNDCPRVLIDDGVDPCVAHSDIKYLKQYVSKHVTTVYSDFVTRFLVDIVRNIVPQWRICNYPACTDESQLVALTRRP